MPHRSLSDAELAGHELMVFAWPEPPSAKSADKSAGVRCGVQGRFAVGGTETPSNRPGKMKAAFKLLLLPRILLDDPRKE